MIFQPQLRIPGPTPLPDRVIRAMSRPLIDHRGPEFAELLREIIEGAAKVFQTSNDLLVLTSSGSGGLESAVANLVSPGDKVVVGVIGNFGERFVTIARAYGAEVVALEVEWGQPLDPDDLAAVLDANPDARVVFLQHNETSTGTTNPLERLVSVIRDRDRIAVVDGVSSISSMPIDVDGWGIDVAISGSQKGWMAPPGIGFVSVSGRAWEHQRSARSPRFYFDWTSHKKNAADGMTPFTPAISVLYGVQEGIRMLFEEGLDNVYRRHRVIADATAAGLEALGFQLFAAPGFRSSTVTSVTPHQGLDVSRFRKLLREDYGVVIAGGQGKMKGKMVRVGHLGAIGVGDIVQVLWAIEQALDELDIVAAEGRALAAAGRVLAGEKAAAFA